MSFKDHDLGKLEHAYLGPNLKLETGGSMKISSPLATTFPFSSTLRHIRNIISSGTWVARGTGLRIVIQLLIDEVIPSYFDRPTFLEGLGILLCNAEIWPQLSLRASLVPSREDRSESTLPLGDLVLNLTYFQNCSNSEANIECPNVPIAQACSPPASVPYAYLDEVKLGFKISAIAPAAKRRRLESTTKYEPDSDMLFGFRDPMDSMVSINQHQPILNRQLQPHLALDNLIMKKLDIGQVSQERPSLMDFSEKKFTIKAGIEATQRGKRSSPHNSAQTADIVFTDLALLIDVGLRSMICDNIVHKPPNIKLISNSGGQKLTEVSPGLFSPGYMQALAQRNSLLPIIANAMPLIYRRAQSLRLKDKIKRLLDVSPEEYVSEELSDSTGHQTITSALTAITKARLWKLSQRKLFDCTAARRLKPLGCTHRAFEQSLESQIILDEGYASSQGRDVVYEALEIREMLDEGYCSQETIFKVAREGNGNLLFEEDGLVLEGKLWESDLLFGGDEEELHDAFLDDDPFWAEEYPLQAPPVDEDLFHGEESTLIYSLGHRGFELPDDIKNDETGGLHDCMEDEVLDGHTPRNSNGMSDGRFGGYKYVQVDVGREEEMLLTG